MSQGSSRFRPPRSVLIRGLSRSPSACPSLTATNAAVTYSAAMQHEGAAWEPSLSARILSLVFHRAVFCTTGGIGEMSASDGAGAAIPAAGRAKLTYDG